MPHITKSKQNLWAQAALAQSSRNSSTSWNITRPSTPSQPSGPPTPTVSPTPPDTPDILSDEESNDAQETFENAYLHVPDLSPESPEEEDGYHIDDDLSELEDMSWRRVWRSRERVRVSQSQRLVRRQEIYFIPWCTFGYCTISTVSSVTRHSQKKSPGFKSLELKR